jgi:hypothetical protein
VRWAATCWHVAGILIKHKCLYFWLAGFIFEVTGAATCQYLHTLSDVLLPATVACRMRYGSQLEQQVQLELMEANKQAAEEFLM